MGRDDDENDWITGYIEPTENGKFELTDVDGQPITNTQYETTNAAIEHASELMIFVDL